MELIYKQDIREETIKLKREEDKRNAGKRSSRCIPPQRNNLLGPKLVSVCTTQSSVWCSCQDNLSIGSLKKKEEGEV